RLVGRDLPWRAFSNFSLEMAFGFLPYAPELFYALDSEKPNLYVLDLRDPTRRWRYELAMATTWRQEIDLSRFTPADPIVQARGEDDDKDGPWTRVAANLISP
ncbi:MAG: hypothetical protein ABI175_15855, partial [Polyangiales bacterium]